jgi:hypothetical protein
MGIGRLILATLGFMLFSAAIKYGFGWVERVFVCVTHSGDAYVDTAHKTPEEQEKYRRWLVKHYGLEETQSLPPQDRRVRNAEPRE